MRTRDNGRVWQSRGFWQRADGLLGGGLLHLYDSYQAALLAAVPETAGVAAPGERAAAVPVLPASITITADGVAITWPDGTKALARPPEPPQGQRLPACTREP